MPKLFVTSDIHSFYEPFIKALNEAGFDPNNEEHWLISCGDCFDRGPDSVKLLHFLMQLERKILVKGNHDLLLDDLCKRGFPYSHDKSNGTFRTVQDLTDSFLPSEFHKACETAWNKTAAYRSLLVNYFETENYIFVHSWIPTFKKESPHPADKWITLTTDEFMEDWRDANDVEWEEAMWGNPFTRYIEGLNQTGKTIVFGHWHCSAGHKMANHCKTEFEDDAIWKPFIGDNVIGLDKCTAHTGEVNVLVLEDTFII